MTNHLAGETSPYLQQHASNPVAWRPWGEEALSLARREDRPILLSIGYSACHWCHVMAHESFEDDAVAEVMNRLFVNIKVDREERPDLDQIYQSAHQMLTGRSGGWPLTMFLTPDGSPFYGGTYFPKTPRYNLPGFTELLERVAQSYRDQRGEIAAQNVRLREALASTLPSPGNPTDSLDRQPIMAARESQARSFDRRHGGFGKAPKFPHPSDLAFLLRRFAGDGDAQARGIALTTLAHMAEGGIHDQLGGGFCRYSVDDRWEIPHFEKMLYDNGPLLGLYADAWAITGKALYREAAEGIASWVMREMQSPEGGYYSSLDADSEGEEGRFYVWTPDEIRQRLSAPEYAIAAPHWGLNAPPNFEGTHWHLRIATALPEAHGELLKSAREKLFAARELRIRPDRDDKILTSWNALMIEGMAHAARVFARPDWLASARRALDFLGKTMWHESGGSYRLLATAKDGHAHLDAYLDDHAYLIAALIEMLQAEFRAGDLEFAEALASALLDQFEDQAQGGFFFTRHDHETLIHRAKPGQDNATPAGNGVAACVLQRLALLTGKSAYALAAERTLQLFQPQLLRQPGGSSSLLKALEEWLKPPRTVILRGPQGEVDEWQARLAQRYQPDTLLLSLPNSLAGLPAALDKEKSDAVNAWVCSGVTCLLPVASWPELQRILDEFA